jgi:hypothetical protein
MTDNPTASSKTGRFLPRIGSPAYHVMLAGVALLILGPLGGISTAFMNFSIGFFIIALGTILGAAVLDLALNPKRSCDMSQQIVRVRANRATQPKCES